MIGQGRGCACGPGLPFERELEDYSGYTWIGLLGMEDPVREGVVDAIQVAQHAGIQVKMITGDYRRTAERIASNIGLMQAGDLTLEGAQIAHLSDAQLEQQVQNTAVFARIRPQDKFRIIRALAGERRGHGHDRRRRQ